MGNIETGMTVRISNDISNTYRECGHGGGMDEMKGKVYKVKSGGLITSLIVSDERQFSYTFLNDDLTVQRSRPKPIPPVTFDPASLDI